MKSNHTRGVIEVWRPHDFAELELRRGFAVTRPVARHWHEEYQLCYIQSGAGELVYRRARLLTPPSSLFMVHPREVHSNSCYDAVGCNYRTLFLDVELVRRAVGEVHLKESGLPFFPTAVVFDEEVIRQYLELHVALEQPSSTLERQGLLLSFLVVLIRRFSENRPAPRTIGLEQQAVRRACDYLAENYADNISLVELARISNLSPFHLNRVFSKQMGIPPHAYQTQLRVGQARKLLRAGWSIPQVASQTGFADQSHLTRHFRRLVAVTPGQYLRKSKNVQDRF